jgi:hypothetical protein
MLVHVWHILCVFTLQSHCPTLPSWFWVTTSSQVSSDCLSVVYSAVQQADLDPIMSLQYSPLWQTDISTNVPSHCLGYWANFGSCERKLELWENFVQLTVRLRWTLNLYSYSLTVANRLLWLFEDNVGQPTKPMERLPEQFHVEISFYFSDIAYCSLYVVFNAGLHCMRLFYIIKGLTIINDCLLGL